LPFSDSSVTIFGLTSDFRSQLQERRHRDLHRSGDHQQHPERDVGQLITSSRLKGIMSWRVAPQADHAASQPIEKL